MSVGTAQYFSVQHAIQSSSSYAFSLARYLVQTIVPDGLGIKNPVLLGACGLQVDRGGRVGILTYGMVGVKQPGAHWGLWPVKDNLFAVT